MVTEEDLISKRELLEKYGISYGALYRWKRMGLIPEDWFLRRATPTGQETFFYRGQICPRVELIRARGEVSLESLAEELNGREVKKPRRRLIIMDRYSAKSFWLDELTAVTVEDGEIRTDFLEFMKGE
ncbi:MAG: DUF4004 family protein [Firmicutes bacterium]|nr:DUF4004 family protein [Bacillota bacterium]